MPGGLEVSTPVLCLHPTKLRKPGRKGAQWGYRSLDHGLPMQHMAESGAVGTSAFWDLDMGLSFSLTPEEAEGPRGGAVAQGKQELGVGLWARPCPPCATRLPVSLQLWGGV